MAGKTVSVTISAKDNISATFAKVGDSSKTMGHSLEKAGIQGEKSLQRISSEAGKAKVSLSDFGAVATTLGSVLAYAGNEALKQQQVILGLQKAFGSAADEYIAFADTIAAHSIFNDDDIMRGQRYFATLKNNYDLTDQQIRQLMQTTADLASAYGVSFEDASSRITSAIRGEGEAAEYLGLTMNQQSIDRENLTLTMTNQEAAQFRLNALYQQTSVYQGAAQELANSEVGTRARLTNAIQDNAQALGSFIGPLGSMVAGTGFAITGIGQMTGALGKLGPLARSGSLGMTALATAVNPVTLGVAALVGGGALLYSQFSKVGEATRQLDADLVSLGDTLEQITLAGDTAVSARLKTTIAQIDAIRDVINASSLPEMNVLLGTSFQRAVEFDTSAVKDDLMRVVDITDDATRAINENLQKLTSAQRQTYLDWINELLQTAETTAEDSNLDEILEQIIITPASQVPGVMDDAAVSTRGFATALGLLKDEADSVFDSLMHINEISKDDNLGQQLMKSLGLDPAQRGQITSTLGLIRESLTPLADMPGPGSDQQDWLEWVNESGISVTEHARRIQAANEARREEAATAAEAAAQEQRLAELTNTSSEALAAGKQHIVDWNETIVAAGEHYQEFIERQGEFIQQARELAGMDDPLSQWNLAGAASDAAILANNLFDVGSAADIAFSTIVGNTESIKSQSDAILSWADGLIAVRGEYSRLDELVSKRFITGTSGIFDDDSQYAKAQDAYDSIAVSTASIHDNLDAVQAIQSPLMADLLEKQATYLGTLRMMPEQQQLIALGWMDATTAGRAFEFQQLAIKAASGEMGSAGEEAFGSYITGAAQADPVLKSLLIDMGLISEGADGTITVNGVEGAQSEVAQLTDSIDALTTTLGGVPPLRIDADTSAAESKIANLLSWRDVRQRFDEDPSGYGAPGAGDLNWKVAVSADTTEAEAQLTTLQGVVEATDMTIGVVVEGSSLAIGQLMAVRSAVDDVPAEVHIDVTALYWDTTVGDLGRVRDAALDIPEEVLVSVGTVGSALAIGQLAAVANAALAIPSDVSTTITTNYVSAYSTLGPHVRHGGIAGYAHGGVVAELAEAGPELVHLASGGIVPVFDRGYYDMPRNSYVSPNNANPTLQAGPSVTIENITVYGSNPEEVKRVFVEEIQPAIVKSLDDRERAWGGPR